MPSGFQAGIIGAERYRAVGFPFGLVTDLTGSFRVRGGSATVTGTRLRWYVAAVGVRDDG
ncbi:hypothetical protein HRbin27_00840 [bacterium HR27]|nr:hypothetical protein HRbin27_00840 [bacterium HR27]